MIVCLFTCPACGAEKIKASARPRTPDEDVRAWMEAAVYPAVQAAHTACSPFCRNSVVDLMIPAPTRAGQRIGEA